MKQCPKCEKMNSAYVDICKFCGADVKWVEDDGTDSPVTPKYPVEESKVNANESNTEQTIKIQNKANLDDIYDRLEKIKRQLSQGSTIIDVNMPFGRMVVLFIKILLAAIPAILIVGFLFLIFWVFLGGVIFNLFFRSFGLQ